jgi:hypothetical protein
MEFLHLRNVVTKLFSQFRSGLDDVGLGEQPNIWLRIRRLCVRITPGARLNAKDLPFDAR